jgi:hypothetical protein
MLKDPKAKALTENFADQWLQLRTLQTAIPDRVTYPAYDSNIRNFMVRETELYFEHVVKEDRSVLEFLDSDYTFVNGPLARFYSISGVTGTEFQKVKLTDKNRGGVLTQASILTLTSNPTRTSPVKRGKWILENLLGAPPPPPPSGVEALKEDQGLIVPGTLRQRMERHRTEPGCASCHRRMDPLGFGLENFDAVGGWRTHEEGRRIDPSGKLQGGRVFQNPAELRALLSLRRDAFARCLTEKMLTYALGRGLERADRRDVDRIMARLARDGYRFSTLVLAVVESESFQARVGK